MPNNIIKKYACDQTDLLTERVSYVADDIETFLSMSPSVTMY